MFDYALPFEAASKGDKKKPEDKKKPDDKGTGKGGGKVKTQMIGEKPGDDLGYDPDKIPVEPI